MRVPKILIFWICPFLCQVPQVGWQVMKTPASAKSFAVGLLSLTPGNPAREARTRRGAGGGARPDGGGARPDIVSVHQT